MTIQEIQSAKNDLNNILDSMIKLSKVDATQRILINSLRTGFEKVLDECSKRQNLGVYKPELSLFVIDVFNEYGKDLIKSNVVEEGTSIESLVKLHASCGEKINVNYWIERPGNVFHSALCGIDTVDKSFIQENTYGWKQYDLSDPEKNKKMIEESAKAVEWMCEEKREYDFLAEENNKEEKKKTNRTKNKNSSKKKNSI